MLVEIAYKMKMQQQAHGSHVAARNKARLRETTENRENNTYGQRRLMA